MKEKLDNIILITSRIYDLYISIIECKLSTNKDKNKLKTLMEYLKICLDVEKNFYNNLILTKDDFVKMISMLNIDNNAKLVFYYEGKFQKKLVKTNHQLEFEYIYDYLFFNDDKKIEKNVNYNNIISRTSNHPIIKRIIFNLFISFYKSKYYEPYVYSDYLQFLNLDYYMEIDDILISEDNINFMEQLYMEASTEFSIRVLNNLKLKPNNDETLYTYMKYLLAFANPKIEQRLLKDEFFDIIEVEDKGYNLVTYSIYNYYISRIAENNLDIMLYHTFEDIIPSSIRTFIFNLTEAVFEEALKFFDNGVKSDYLEELKKIKENTDDDEYVLFIDTLLKNENFIYKKTYTRLEGENNV